MKTQPCLWPVAVAAIWMIAMDNTPANAALLANWRLDDTIGPAVCDADATFNGSANGAILNWNLQAGKVYDLLSATDLTTPPADWDVWNGNADMIADSLTIPWPGDPKRFFALRERDGP